MTLEEALDKHEAEETVKKKGRVQESRRIGPSLQSRVSDSRLTRSLLDINNDEGAQAQSTSAPPRAHSRTLRGACVAQSPRSDCAGPLRHDR
jgi:hypothetical protein